MIKSIVSLLKGSEWSEYLTYISPSFFDVVPPLGVLQEATKLARSVKSDPRETQSSAQETWACISRIAGDLPDRDPGTLALAIYFFQLLYRKSSQVDLRSRSFTLGNQKVSPAEQLQVTWTPALITSHWNTDFLSSLRLLYQGFYRDDHPTFEKALNQLGLSPAKDVLWQHFGTGDQSEVTFRLSEFRESFHKVFLVCKEHKLKLHPQFLNLGVILVCLYEHLESRNRTFNVRQIFKTIESYPSHV